MPGADYNAALVERVRSFVDTVDLDTGEDQLASPAAFSSWLKENDLLDPEPASTRPRARSARTPGRRDPVGERSSGSTPAELALARELRDSLRQLLAGHGRHRGDRSATATAIEAAARQRLEQLSTRLPLRVDLCCDDQPRLVPAVPVESGARHSLGKILAAAVTMSPDDWVRLKVCPADDCQWVFYDESRNRSRRWCSMEGCGNRHKVRAYRDRQ